MSSASDQQTSNATDAAAASSSSSSSESSSSSGASIELRCLIDAHSVGAIIGRAGQTVQRVRDESKAVVSILKPNSPSFPAAAAVGFNAPAPPERILLIKATTTAPVLAAIVSVSNILLEAARNRHASGGAAAAANNSHEDNKVSLRILVHQSLVGAIIGRGGEVIKNTSVSSGARISVSNQALPNSTDKSITISGSPAAIQGACATILQQIADNPLRPNVRSFPYHPVATVFPQHPTPGFSVLLGQPNQNIPTVTQKIAIPSNASGAIIGKGGSVIRDLRMQSQCQISIADPDSSNAAERIVTLTGTPGGIQVAMHLIRVAVEGVTQRTDNHHDSNHTDAPNNSQRKPRRQQHNNANNGNNDASHQ